MNPRTTIILCTLAGFASGAALVGGLALQPERASATREAQPEDRPPEDREGRRPNARPGQPGGRRMIQDPERLVRRLEEVSKRLDAERELVSSVLGQLKGGTKPEAIEEQIREALMLSWRRPENAPQERPENPPDRRPGPEERLELLRVIREADAPLADRMEDFQKRRPLVGGGILANIAPRPGEVIEARAKDPELFDLYRRQISTSLDVADHAFELVDLLKEGETDAVKLKRQELRDAVGRSVDIRGELQQRDLASLEHRVEDLRARIKGAIQDREKNIDAFITRVTRIIEDLRKRGGRPDGPPGEGPEGRRPGGRPQDGPPPQDRAPGGPQRPPR